MKRRHVLAGLVGLVTLAFAGTVAHLGFGFGGARLDPLFDDWFYETILVVAALACLARGVVGPGERRPWLLVGVGLTCWTAGDLYYTFVLSGKDSIPFPSVDDALYLSFYPPVYVALIMLARQRTSAFRPSMWLDGLSGALAVGAVGAAVVFEAVLASVSGASPAVVATNLAYPLADLLLLAVVVLCAALNSWRVDRGAILVAGGFALFALCDSLYLYQTANGTYAEGGILDAGWLAACLLFALAAWQPTPPRRIAPPESWRMLAFPSAAGLAGISILVVDHFHRVGLLAVILAAAAILTVVARLGLTFAEYLRMIATSLHQATTDPLTGLPNRRQLMSDIEDLIDAERPAVLGLFDLDGFKHYNDTFGHPAGDALLIRLAAALGKAMADSGSAYRMGGDEFCVLIAGDCRDELLRDCTGALSETGAGFTITASAGAVELRFDGSTASDLLTAADQRMYTNKNAGRPSPGRQSANVLSAALQVRDGDSGEHGSDVAELAVAVADRLAISDEERENVALAGQLHDVGKIGVPGEILDKAGPLDEAEWEFVRRHTLIGERIVRSAPALADVAPLVRASHERWDGDGYPDGLAGAEIPLAARIVAVCDSYHAMVTDRVYRPGRTAQEAVAELRRCAGSQFDPKVVAAFCSVLVERSSRTFEHVLGRARPGSASAPGPRGSAYSLSDGRECEAA